MKYEVCTIIDSLREDFGRIVAYKADGSVWSAAELGQTLGSPFKVTRISCKGKSNALLDGLDDLYLAENSVEQRKPGKTTTLFAVSKQKEV